MKDWDLIKSLFSVENPQGLSAEELTAIKEDCGPLPAVLEEFYRTFGNEEKIISIQDTLVLPNHPAFADEQYLVFFNENQGVCQAGIRKEDRDQPDPPVYVDYREGKWRKTCDSVSEFLMAIYCHQAALCLDFSVEAFYWITEEELAYVNQHFTELPCRIKDWINASISVYSNNRNSMVAVMDSGDCMMLYSANNEKDYLDMQRILAGIGEEV